MTMDQGSASYRATIALGVALIGLGVAALVLQIVQVTLPLRMLWPLLFTLTGVLLLAAMVGGGRAAGPLAIPGSILSVLGMVLFVQNATGLWATWAWAWAFVPLATGVGMLIGGWWSGIDELRQDGVGPIMVGVIGLVVGFAFFEGVLGISRLPIAGSPLTPLTFIAGGIALIVAAPLFRRAFEQRF
ncbi:MAG: hypothetical protein NZ518_02360 [Dehalococcoidia bacterium]|nr:hypothetical protein [Dehalococcoidia bacterium]